MEKTSLHVYLCKCRYPNKYLMHTDVCKIECLRSCAGFSSYFL
jgi:hypothetical protein